MRILALFCGGFSLGMVLLHYLLPMSLWLPLAGVSLLLGIWVGRCSEITRWRMRLLLGGLCFCCLWRTAYTELVYTPIQEWSGTSCFVTAEVCDLPQSTAWGEKVTVNLTLENGRTVRAIWYGTEELQSVLPCDRLSGKVRLQEAGELRGERLHNFTGKGIWLLAYQKEELSITAGQQNLLVRLQLAIAQRFAQLYPQEVLGLVSGMVMGDTTALTTEQTVYLTESGLYHIVSISGFHCAVLLGFFRLLWKGYPKRMARGTIPCLIAYTLLVGSPVSMIRASLMLSLLLLAPVVGRQYDAPTAFCVSLFLVLLQNPYAIGSIALQLTFASTASILWLSPKFYRKLCGKEPTPYRRKIAASLAVTFGALLGTTPFTSLYFHSVSLLSPLSNLLGLPICNLIFFGGLLSLLLSCLWLPLGQGLAFGVSLLCQLLLELCQWGNTIPYHALYIRERPLAFVASLCLWLVCPLPAFPKEAR